ncbi:Uncharacterised protein [Candidatus Gugararchaeum adminiculabundum]|nr:Uncharacterised protein [Candidatus Gugararchaeum adminiculabundum]
MATEENIQQKKRAVLQQVVIQYPPMQKSEQKDFFAKQMQIKRQEQRREEQLKPLLDQQQKPEMAVKIARKEVRVTHAQVSIPAPTLRSKLRSMFSGISTGMQVIDTFFGKDGDYWYYKSPENLGYKLTGPKERRRQQKKLAPILKESKAA